MGDRGNIVVEDAGKRVFLYTHWGGSEIPLDLKKALEKRWRWNDPSYLCRIIFDVMSEDHQGEGTGFGISARLGDGEYPLLVVDAENGRVTAEPLEGGGTLATWSFEEYVALDMGENPWDSLGLKG